MDEKSTAPVPISEIERDLITATFKDNESLAKILRALFTDLNVTEEDKKVVRELSPEIKRIIKQRFLPEMHNDVPIGTTQDCWIGAETMVFQQHKETIAQSLGYKQGSIEMTRRAIDLLNNPDGPKVGVDWDYSPAKYPMDDLGIVLLTRNQYVRHVGTQLFTLLTIANVSKKTPKQLAEAARKDSPK